MALRLSTGLCTNLLGTSGAGANQGGQSFEALMQNGWFDIYSGSQPASADYVETGTKLARISSTQGQLAADGLKFGTAATGVLPIGGVSWQGVVQVAGVAGWGRYYASSGTGGLTGSSGTALRFDVSIGVSGADLNLSYTNLVVGSVITLQTFYITQPSQ